jgi:hypothetical protein
MAAPITVSASGYFETVRAGVAIGKATLRMRTATQGVLTQGADSWKITGDPIARTLRSTAPGSVLNLRIVTRSLLRGTVDGDTLELRRAVLRSIPPAELAQFDSGPTGAIKAVMDATPDYQAAVGDTSTFWYAFGPVLYRGRLDGTARVLGIASDPGPCRVFALRPTHADRRLGAEDPGLSRQARPHALIRAGERLRRRTSPKPEGQGTGRAAE